MAPSPQLHVLWLTEHYYPGQGGMARSCDRLVQSLRARGVCIDVVHFTPRASSWTFERKHQGRYLACPLDDDVPHTLQCLWNMLATDPALQTLTHVVAFGGFVPLLAAPTCAAWLNVPLVTLLRGNDFDLGLFTPGRRAILCEALERAACVCVVSRSNIARIRALVPQAHPVCIPGGIDLETWHPLPSEQQAAAAWRHHTVAPERRVLGLFGTIKKKKGGIFLLQALRDAACAQGFHLLGIGTFEEAMMRWLDEQRAEVPSTLYPFMERFHLLRYYLACDLLVLPSFYDGFPNVLLEAMALARPVLASTAGGMGDVLQDGHHGFLFAPGDLHGCRSALQRAARASDDTLRCMGEACQSLVRAELHAGLEAERYQAVLLDTYDQFGHAKRCTR